MPSKPNNVIYIIVSMLLVAVVAGYFLWFHQSVSKYTQQRVIRYSFTLQNTTNRLLENAEFWAYGPVSQTSWQLSGGIKSSHPYKLITDELGNQILHFKFKRFAPYASQVITITATLNFAEKANRLDLPNKSFYLNDTPYMPVNDERIAQLAAQNQRDSLLDSAKQSYLWTHKNIQYAGYIKEDRGALYALTNKKGDCTEYMYLFGALVRANGIPMRGVGGYVYSEDKILNPKDFHNWAEVYIDGAWRVVDPQNGRFLEQQEHYIAMRIISDQQQSLLKNTHRFTYSGEGLKVKMN